MIKVEVEKSAYFSSKKYADFSKKDFECARHTFFVFKEKCQKMGLRDKKSSENDDSLESILFKYGNKGILSGVLLPLNIEFECIFDLEPGNRYSI